MPHDETILGLPGYEIKEIWRRQGMICVSARYTGPIRCVHCGSRDLRKKALFTRRLRHESWGMRPCELELEARKFHCRSCGKYFNQRFPGVGSWSGEIAEPLGSEILKTTD